MTDQKTHVEAEFAEALTQQKLRRARLALGIRAAVVLALTLVAVNLVVTVAADDRVPAKARDVRAERALFELEPGIAVEELRTRGGLAPSPDVSTSTSQRHGAGTDWCGHIIGGPAGTRDFRVDLSAAHATTRAFSVASAFTPSDRALVAALGAPASLKRNAVDDVLQTYAAALDDVCAADALKAREELGPARVQRFGSIALVTPGIGQPTIPSGTAVVVIDLRELPAVGGLDAALARAVAPALATPVALPVSWLRGHFGPVDQFFSFNSVYGTFVTFDEQQPLPVTGSRDLPLVLLTSKRMAPAAARFAGTLRIARRAWIVGDDVFAGVAEADWRGVADEGLAIRTKFLDQLSRSPQFLPKQLATQDDPNDPSTAGYRRNVHVGADTHLLDVTVQGPNGSDIDLYLLRDINGDGLFTYPDELIDWSYSFTPHEHIVTKVISNPGEYQIWVHGFWIPGGTAAFDLEMDLRAGQLWPDVIPADAYLGNLAADSLRLARTAPGPVSGAAERSFPNQFKPFGIEPVVTGKPELRAALLVAHGTTRLFFPYFDTVGDRIDPRLVETLEAAEEWDGSDRKSAAELLQRFGEALHDGHQFVFDFGPRTYGYLPVFLEEVGGRPVVRRSAIPEIAAGDTILSMNGRRIEDVYAEQYRLISTATHGYQFDVASRYVSRLYGTTTLRLMDPAGVERSVTIEPKSLQQYIAAVDPGVSARPSGPLTDLGAPTLYYLNLDGYASPNTEIINAAIADAIARGSAGLIVDGRGYPWNPFSVPDTASRLINDFFLHPQFITTERLGPDRSQQFLQQAFGAPPAAGPRWSGPLVLLTGPHAASASEWFQQMLVGSGRLTAVVGQQSSAGTNGDLTGISLPGGFGFTFTGARVLNPDGSRFHGIGIVPTVRTSLSAVDLRDGVDHDILAAIGVLGGSH